MEPFAKLAYEGAKFKSIDPVPWAELSLVGRQPWFQLAEKMEHMRAKMMAAMRPKMSERSKEIIRYAMKHFMFRPSGMAEEWDKANKELEELLKTV